MELRIIAEAAQGYMGDPTIARLFAQAAGNAGANWVKFQLVYADELAVPGHPWYDHYRSVEMPDSAWQAVVAVGTPVIFDVFGTFSLKKAKELGAAGVKLHASDFFNPGLLELATETFDTVFLSVGGIELQEMRERLASFKAPANVVLMAGFQAEPTAIQDTNLGRLPVLKTEFPSFGLGFMDHLAWNEDPTPFALIAQALGATVVEKHITLGQAFPLVDRASALDADRFTAYVANVRKLETALGTGIYDLTEAEHAYRGKALKAVLAARDLPAGEVLTLENISFKRPATPAEVPLFQVEKALGKTLTRGLRANEAISLGDLQ